MKTISVQELKEKIDAGTAPAIIDVREQHEWDMGHLDVARHMPMGEVPNRVSELTEYKEAELIIHCRSGGRSGNVAQFLTSQGFTNVYNLTGGMLAWKDQIDPSFNVM